MRFLTRMESSICEFFSFSFDEISLVCEISLLSEKFSFEA